MWYYLLFILRVPAIWLQAIYLAILIVSVITLSTIDDIYSDDLPDDSEGAENRDKYRYLAKCLARLSTTGIIVHVIMVIVGVLYHDGIIKAQLTAVLVSFIT